MSNDKLQQEFEAAYVEEMVRVNDEAIRGSAQSAIDQKMPNGEYVAPMLRLGLWAWKASRAAAEELPTGHAEVSAMMERFEAAAEEEYRRAETFIRESGRASISALQRKFKIAYGSACRLMDRLVERGVVTPTDSEGRRSIVPEVKP